MDVLTLTVYIWMYFQNLRLEDPKIIEEVAIDFSTLPGVNTSVILGTLKLKNVEIKGFSTLPADSPSSSPVGENIVVTEDTQKNNYVCVKNILLDYIHFSGEYDADIGILDEIPIYGVGSFEFGIQNISIELCTYVDWLLSRVDDFETIILYRHQPITLSGFWKNADFSAFLTKVLTTAHKMFAIWNAYDPNCASCVLSPVFEFLMNAMVMKNPNSSFNFESCSCTDQLAESLHLESLIGEERRLGDILMKNLNCFLEGNADVELIETIFNLFVEFSEECK